MRDSGLTPAQAGFESRQRRFTERLASRCEESELYDYPMPGALLSRAVERGHKHGRTAEMAEATRDTSGLLGCGSCRAMGGKEGRQSGDRHSYIWWTDGSRTDDGKVGATAVSKHGTVPQLPGHRKNGSV